MPVDQENKMEGYRGKVGCATHLNITKVHSRSPEVDPAARDMRSRVWTSASPAPVDCGLLMEKEVSHGGKPVLVQWRIFVACSQSCICPPPLLEARGGGRGSVILSLADLA